MKMHKVNEVADVLRAARVDAEFSGESAHTLDFVVEQLADVFGSVVGFERSAFFRQCGADSLADANDSKMRAIYGWGG